MNNEADPTPARCRVELAEAGQRQPQGRRRPRRADRDEPRPVFRRRPPDAVHVAGARPGVRGAGRRRSVGQGRQGSHPQQRRSAEGAAAVRHRSRAVRDRAAARARPTTSTVRHSVNAARAGVEARARRCRRPRPIATWPSRTRPSGTAVQGGPRRDFGAPPRNRAGDARGGAQQGAACRGRSAQGAGGGRRKRRENAQLLSARAARRKGRARPRAHARARPARRHGHRPAHRRRQFRAGRRAGA